MTLTDPHETRSPETLFATAERLGRPKFNARVKKKPPCEWWPLTVGSIVLAIDPSMTCTGWAILEKTAKDPIRIDSGNIYPTTTCPRDMSRYDWLASQVAKRCVSATSPTGRSYTPTDAVIEIPRGGGRGGAQMITYVQAVATCATACYFAGLGVNRLPVGTWKGRGKKEETHRLVKQLLKYDPREENECDALGLGLWICYQ